MSSIEWCFPFSEICKNNGDIEIFCLVQEFHAIIAQHSVIFIDFPKRKAPFNRTHQDAIFLFNDKTF